MCTFSKFNEVLKFAKLLKRSAYDLFVTSTCDTVCCQHRFIYKCQREQQIEITDKQSGDVKCPRLAGFLLLLDEASDVIAICSLVLSLN